MATTDRSKSARSHFCLPARDAASWRQSSGPPDTLAPLLARGEPSRRPSPLQPEKGIGSTVTEHGTLDVTARKADIGQHAIVEPGDMAQGAAP